jgi:hypothetical protein
MRKRGELKMELCEQLSAVKRIRSFKNTLDFACPPKGDGKTKSGEPDKRCGDGKSKPSGGSKSSGGSDGKSESGGGSKSSGGSGPLSKNENAAKDIEKEIRNNPGESGYGFIDGKPVDGIVKENKDRIVLLNDENMQSLSSEDRLNMTLTHNHPKDKNGDIGGSFSPGDFEMSAKYGIGEVRAVDSEYTYSLKWNGGPRDDFSFRGNKESRSIATNHNKNLKSTWDNKRKEIMESKPSDMNKANKEFLSWAKSEGTHIATQKTAERYGFTYTRVKN